MTSATLNPICMLIEGSRRNCNVNGVLAVSLAELGVFWAVLKWDLCGNVAYHLAPLFTGTMLPLTFSKTFLKSTRK